MGYKMAAGREKGSKKTLPDAPDENTFPILQTALREFSRGEHTQASFAIRLDSLGLQAYRGKKMTLQGVQLILTEKRLRFYAGEVFNKWKDTYGMGLHVPMLTGEEVLDILAVLSGKRRKLSQTRDHKLFPLRGGTILCGSCIHPLTGSSARGNTKIHHYYHCYNKQCELYAKSLRKNELEDSFVEKLDKIAPTEKFVALFKKAVLMEWETRLGQHNRAYNEYTTQLATLERKKQRIYDMHEDGSYSQEEFRERKGRVENEIRALSISKSETNIDRMELEMLLDKATQFLNSLGSHWKKQPLHIQKRFQQLVYPDGVSYSRVSGVGTAKLGLIFELNQRFMAQKSIRVDRTGFEPATLSLQMRCSTN
jgi:site-specific DNA recombinase